MQRHDGPLVWRSNNFETIKGTKQLFTINVSIIKNNPHNAAQHFWELCPFLTTNFGLNIFRLKL